jgi:hypothetical protein
MVKYQRGSSKKEKMRKAAGSRWSTYLSKKEPKNSSSSFCDSEYSPSLSVCSFRRSYNTRKKLKRVGCGLPAHNITTITAYPNDPSCAIQEQDDAGANIDEDPTKSLDSILPFIDLRRLTPSALNIMVFDGYWKFLQGKCERFRNARSQASQNAVVVPDDELPLSFLTSKKLVFLMDCIECLINSMYDKDKDSNFDKASSITYLAEEICRWHSYNISSKYLRCKFLEFINND